MARLLSWVPEADWRFADSAFAPLAAPAAAVAGGFAAATTGLLLPQQLAAPARRGQRRRQSQCHLVAAAVAFAGQRR